jgi:hypothetical protein
MENNVVEVVTRDDAHGDEKKSINMSSQDGAGVDFACVSRKAGMKTERG